MRGLQLRAHVRARRRHQCGNSLLRHRHWCRGPPDRLDEVSASLTIEPRSILHKYSCDCSPAAQQFVLQHVDPPPEMFFLDISEIFHEYAFDAVTKQTMPVPYGLDLFFCGFECKSISGLNLSRSKNAKCPETKDQLMFIAIANVSQVKLLPFA